MKRVLKTYQLELKVCGPVFVGSGAEIQKKEYLFLNRKTVGIADINKLYMLVKKKHLEKDFESFMVTNGREDLKHWLDRNRISKEEIENCLNYKVNVGDLQMEKGRMQIMSFMRDPYGNPYVPGSSIKGMLRTILLSMKLMHDPLYYKADGQQIKSELKRTDRKFNRNTLLKKNISHIEEKAFNTIKRTENNKEDIDVMSGIIISDSEPLSNDDIILCQKWEYHVDGSSKSLNLLRECLRPGIVIKTQMTVDESINPITEEDIMKAVKSFYEYYYSVFQKKFAVMDQMADETVFLGGGSGFVSKTVVYSLLGEKEGIQVIQSIFEKTGVPREHKHFQDGRIGVSPHILKCTKYCGKTYMMGQCNLKIRQVNRAAT